MTLIGIDVGATKTLGVRTDVRGTVLASARTPTPKESAEKLMEAVWGMVRALSNDRPSAIGVGLPGMVDDVRGVLAFAPRPLTRQLDIRASLMKRTSVPIVLSNDANAATWAEARIGAGVGHDDLVGVIVGTGVGCGVIVSGRLLRGAHGYASEIGTLIAGSPHHGRLEDLASGSAIERMGQDRAWTTLDDASDAPFLTGGSAVTAAALRGSQAARDILTAVGTNLGTGIAALINIFDPSLVVIGGGVAAAGSLLLEPVREACARHIYGVEERPTVDIMPAKLGEEAGAIGAALLAAQAT